ncbi:tryptophan-rich sensory protein [Kribbella sp. NBC_01505]|uniref:TspO/MBR family protein n=1 Tax=Kribbella sp. NBC_01505 TaxID=2903580 RepID=UPI0038662BC4
MSTLASPTTRRSVSGLLMFVAAAVATALIGVLAVTDTAEQYKSLDQPSWAPPSWLFGPVWTVLYALIAISGWLVWRRTGWSAELVPFAVQLVLNAVWTPLFFGFGLRGLALIDIALLWLAIAWTVVRFRGRSGVAVWLLVPYWLWTTFAAALNAAVWSLNRG